MDISVPYYCVLHTFLSLSCYRDKDHVMYACMVVCTYVCVCVCVCVCMCECANVSVSACMYNYAFPVLCVSSLYTPAIS